MAHGHGGQRDGAGRPKKDEERSDVQAFNSARARKESALAHLREMEVAQRMRSLIPAHEAEEILAVTFAQIAQSLLSFPDLLERRAGLPPEATELVDQTVHSLLERITDQLATLQAGKPVQGEAAARWLADVLRRSASVH